MFSDRIEAGKKLAERLIDIPRENSIILAIPRGGVIVAAEVAKVLKLPLDIIIPRKIGAPGNEELAIGAVVRQNDFLLNENLVISLGITDDYIQQKIKEELDEIDRRRSLYLGNRKFPSLINKNIFLIDDGVATGYTMLATIHAIRKEQPQSIIAAVPVAPQDTVTRLKNIADQVYVLLIPKIFYAVGQFYANFNQTSDSEVINALKTVNNSG